MGAFRVSIEVRDPAGLRYETVDGRTELTLVVFGEPGTPPLLGAYALEGLRLRGGL